QSLAADAPDLFHALHAADTRHDNEKDDEADRHFDQLDESVAKRLHLDGKLGLGVAEQNPERDRLYDLHVEDGVPRPAGRRAHCLGHAHSFSCTGSGLNGGWRNRSSGLQTMSPTPDDERQVYSELKLPIGRLKMRSPNHASSRAAGMKASDSLRLGSRCPKRRRHALIG